MVTIDDTKPLGRSQDLTQLPPFERLKAVRYVGKDQWGMAFWECRCECGEVLPAVDGHSLRRGHTRSCGCLRADLIRARHGDKPRVVEMPEYRAWQSMKHRCYTTTCRYYPRYGGRGITVCPRWLASFTHFLADVGPRPSSRHSIDRYPDNNGNYEPGNVRWATRKEQQRNMRSNRLVTHDGQTKTLAEWVESTGLTRDTLRGRLARGEPIIA